MKVFKLLLLSFSFVAIFFASCKKDDAAPIVSNSNPAIVEAPNLKVENGMLVFSDITSFSNTYLWMHSNVDKINTTFDDIKGFTSMKKAFFNIDVDHLASLEDLNQYSDIAYWKNESGENSQEMLVHNLFYANLFNEKGLVKIGDKIGKVGVDQNWYFFDEKYLSKIATFRNLSEIPNVQKLDVPKVKVNSNRGTSEIMFCHNGYYTRRVNCSSSPGWIMTAYISINGFPPTYTGTGTDAFVYTKKRGLFGAWVSHSVDKISMTSGIETWTSPINQTLSSAVFPFIGNVQVTATIRDLSSCWGQNDFSPKNVF